MKKSFLFLLLTIIVSTFYSSTVNAQLEFPEDKVSWKFTAVQNEGEATIVGTITMEEHWHIYAAHMPEGTYLIATEVNLNKSADFKTVGGVIEPKPHFERDELADEDLYYHSNTIQLKRKIKVLSENDFVLKGTFSFQTCDDTHCLPPYDAEFEVKIKGFKKAEENKLGEIDFSLVPGDETSDLEGNQFVKVNKEWFKVPEGNSSTFYKKYLSLGGKHEE